jgi:hypothetical protein
VNFVISSNNVREPLPVTYHLLTDKNVDVRPQSAAFVSDVKTDAWREPLKRLNDFSRCRCIDNDVLAFELRKKRVQVAS